MSTCLLSIVTSLAHQLGLPSGDFYLRLYALIPLWLGATCLLSLLAWRASGPFAHWLVSARPSWSLLVGNRIWFALILWCIALVVLADGRGFYHGFFRQDDFSFLEVVREADSPGAQMLLYHNDHPYPLYRLQVWSMLKIIGSNVGESTLARWFNLVSFLVHSGILVAGCWLLRESGVKRACLWMFPLALWVWPGWGEFTAGFYTLSVYSEVLLMGLVAAACVLRGFRLRQWPWLVAGFLFALLGCGLNISGVWIIGALGLLAIALRWPFPEKFDRIFAGSVILVFVFVAWLYLVAFHHELSARELVQNPGAHTLDSRLESSMGLRFLQWIRIIPVALGGTLLGLMVPTFLQFAVEQIADMNPLRWLLLAAEIGVFSATALLAWKSLGRQSHPHKNLLVAYLGIAIAGLTLVVIARPEYATTIPPVFWHAKYMAMPFTWLILALTVWADSTLKESTLRSFTGTRIASLVVCCAAWLVLSNTIWEKTLLPQPISYLARGRWGNVQNAEVRREQYRDYLSTLTSLSVKQHSPDLILPAPPSLWGAAFFEKYPLLEWGDDYTPNGVTHRFADMLAARPCLDLKIHWTSPEQIEESRRKELLEIPWLQPAFSQTTSPPTPLKPEL